ncbi:hypothetical protein TNCV_1285511 [Trichonephila clavipes]|uniref:Uncharacterized protein n=1 Tax=Trichonephila clavipes TaxID=2585209 RepID=A0A8X6SWZ9_TRICX|nr:hypothetical protein TNCV_1285511 [Trichonephila clavipes]
MERTKHNRTGVRKPRLVRVIRKNNYEGYDVGWNEKGQKEVRDTFSRRKACLQYEQCITAQRHKCNDKCFHRNFSKLHPYRSQHRLYRRMNDCRMLSTKSDVLEISGDPCREILHCSHLRLIHKRFEVAPKEEIQEIEVQGAQRPNNESAISNLPPGICTMLVVTHLNRKMSNIVHVPHFLVSNGRYTMQKLL